MRGQKSCGKLPHIGQIIDLSVSSRLFREDDLYDLYDMYDLAHVAGGERYILHNLGHVP